MDLDETVELYVSESLESFLNGCYLASTIMLGGASEKLLLILIDTFSNFIEDDKKREDFKKRTKTFIVKVKYNEFLKEFKQIKKDIPKELTRDMDIWFEGIFNFIRNIRNEVGHPTGRRIPRQLVYANLQLFPEYAENVYNLIKYFEANSAI